VKRITFAAIFGLLAGLITLPQILPIPLPPYAVAILTSAVTLVAYPLADDLYQRVMGKDEKSTALLKHYDELKDAFTMWKDSKLIRSTIVTQGVSYHSASVPIFLKIDKDEQISVFVKMMAHAHLQYRRYKDDYAHYLKCKELTEEHNKKADDFIRKVESETSFMLLKYPMLSEMKQGEELNNYLRQIIVPAIAGQFPVSIIGKEIYADNVILARVQDDLIRQLFMGEIRSLTARYSENFEELQKDFVRPYTELVVFTTFMARLINSIDDLHELEGECGFEKGKMRKYA
jgi:hypothetical protein